VQELCAAVLASESAQDQRVPELAQIAITPEGEVKLLGKGPRAQWLVHRVGAVLLALVPEQQLPLQLRLLALEEVSPAPKFPSIRDLTTELEFFERPDRRLIVQGVYERYRQMTTPEALAKPVPPPLLEPAPPRKPALGWWKRKSTRIGVAVGLVAAASMGLAWEWQRPEGRWLRDSAAQASAATSEATQWTRERAGQGLEAAKGALGVDKPVSTPPGPGARFVDASRTSTPRPPVGPEPLLAHPVPGAVQAGAPAGAPPVGLPDQVESGIWEAVGWVPGTVPPPSVDESAIFTSADIRVVPAGLVRPRVPRREGAGGDRVELPEVELVVSASGEVESVRLVSPGGGAKTAMMLSALKTWRFQPATLNGEPVRFRLRMKLIG